MNTDRHGLIHVLENHRAETRCGPEFLWGTAGMETDCIMSLSVSIGVNQWFYFPGQD